MSDKIQRLIPSEELVRRLHLMADSGGMLTRDRIEAIRQAADRLELVHCLPKKEGERNEEH